MRSPRTTMKLCSSPGCTAEFPDHAWGAIKANGEGWFMSKDGVQAWCPAHVPDWVPAWGFRIFSRRAPALGQLQGRRPQGEKVGISHCSFSESSMVPAQELQNLLGSGLGAHMRIPAGGHRARTRLTGPRVVGHAYRLPKILKRPPIEDSENKPISRASPKKILKTSLLAVSSRLT